VEFGWEWQAFGPGVPVQSDWVSEGMGAGETPGADAACGWCWQRRIRMENEKYLRGHPELAQISKVLNLNPKHYRGTSLIRKRSTPKDPPRHLGTT